MSTNNAFAVVVVVVEVISKQSPVRPVYAKLPGKHQVENSGSVWLSKEINIEIHLKYTPKDELYVSAPRLLSTEIKSAVYKSYT